MGGTALKHLGFESQRVEKREYFLLVQEIKTLWEQNFNTNIKDVLHYSNKSDYGDIDLVAACTNDQEITKEKIQQVFGCQYISKNSCVYSFDYKNVQVDLAVLDGLYDFHSYYIFSCYSPIGNVIGRLIKQKGLKWGIDGLSYPVKLSDSEQLGVISILYKSNPYDTFERVLQFLGVEYNIDRFFKNYFEDQKDIFEWLSSSKLFNKDIFAFENLNHVNRKRDHLRNDYHNWLEYIQDKPNKFEGRKDKSVYIEEISNFFNIDLHELIEQRIANHQMERFYKEKFNGKHLIEWGIKDGKLIGECISSFKQYITGCTNKENLDRSFKNYILLKELEYIKKDFMNWFSGFPLK
jgi:hypothetical protein